MIGHHDSLGLHRDAYATVALAGPMKPNEILDQILVKFLVSKRQLPQRSLWLINRYASPIASLP
jgi:hypothetical protein